MIGIIMYFLLDKQNGYVASKENMPVQAGFPVALFHNYKYMINKFNIKIN